MLRKRQRHPLKDRAQGRNNHDHHREGHPSHPRLPFWCDGLFGCGASCQGQRRDVALEARRARLGQPGRQARHFLRGQRLPQRAAGLRVGNARLRRPKQGDCQDTRRRPDTRRGDARIRCHRRTGEHRRGAVPRHPAQQQPHRLHAPGQPDGGRHPERDHQPLFHHAEPLAEDRRVRLHQRPDEGHQDGSQEVHARRRRRLRAAGSPARVQSDALAEGSDEEPQQGGRPGR